MNTGIIVTTMVTVALAVMSYFATYLNNLRLSQRAERLSRINKQLSELYGPLFALSFASNRAWKAFRSKYGSNRKYFFDDVYPPNEEDLKAFRLWMTSVFMPVNKQMYELVLSNADLLIEPMMPEPLLELCAHVSAYIPVLKKWDMNEYDEHESLIEFPETLITYCSQAFQYLKAEQSKLIGYHLEK